MMRFLSPCVAYPLFALGAILATMPVWRLALFGFHPTLDELLNLGCLPLDTVIPWAK
jgi:hypothetical protein